MLKSVSENHPESRRRLKQTKRTEENAALVPAPYEFPRGIAPSILLDHIKNTVPFLFERESAAPWQKSLEKASFVQCILKTEQALAQDSLDLSHEAYYELCLSAHHATVASFVPTDVDNQIRFKLWHPGLPPETVVAMADLTLASLHWDSSALTTRKVRLNDDTMPLSGHHGEWFSTAVAAYGALRRPDPDRAKEMCAAIIQEVKREASIFLEFKKRGDGINLLKTATLIAHNLGDLDRVLEMWNIGEDDELRRAVYKCGHEDGSDKFGGTLSIAGRLNKALMAVENHRHFSLRAPKCLRQSPELFIPIGPFFDDWGHMIGRHEAIASDDVGEIVQALVSGWDWLNKNKQPGPGKAAMGYSRALAGIIDSFPGGFPEVARLLPARIERHMKAGTMRTQINVPRARFEDQWNSMAFKTLKN